MTSNDDISKQLKALSNLLVDTASATDNISTLVQSADDKGGALSSSYSDINNRLSCWVPVASASEDFASKLVSRLDDAELGITWDYLIRRLNVTELAANLCQTISASGITISLNGNASLIPCNILVAGDCKRAIGNVVLLVIPLVVNLSNKQCALATSTRISFIRGDDKTVRIVRLCPSTIVSQEYWEMKQSASLSSELLPQLDSLADSAVATTTWSARFVYELGPDPQAPGFFYESQAIATVFHIRCDAFLRMSLRIWIKSLYASIQGKITPFAPDSGPQNPVGYNPYTSPETPRLAAIPASADSLFKVTASRFCWTITMYILDLMEAQYFDSKSECVTLHYGDWGLDPNANDPANPFLFWGFVYHNFNEYCKSGHLACYDWQLQYVCDDWEVGEMQYPFQLRAGVTSQNADRQLQLFLSFSAENHTVKQYPLGFDCSSLSALASGPLLLIQMAL